MPRIGDRDGAPPRAGARDPLAGAARLVRAARGLVAALAGRRGGDDRGDLRRAARQGRRRGRRARANRSSRRRRSGACATRCRRCRSTWAARSSTTSPCRWRPIPEFIERASAAVETAVPGRAALPLRPSRRRQHPFQRQPAGRHGQGGVPRPRGRGINDAVYRGRRRLGGTISAEHGIGRLKRDLLPKVQERRSRSSSCGGSRRRSIRTAS